MAFVEAEHHCGPAATNYTQPFYQRFVACSTGREVPGERTFSSMVTGHAGQYITGNSHNCIIRIQAGF